jgi:hypothetical protein
LHLFFSGFRGGGGRPKSEISKQLWPTNGKLRTPKADTSKSKNWKVLEKGRQSAMQKYLKLETPSAKKSKNAKNKA